MFRQLATSTIRRLIRGYQIIVSPIIGPRCRHLPTCSDYMLEAVEAHGIGYGFWLGCKRLFRCHPWGTSGYDPVPEVNPKTSV